MTLIGFRQPDSGTFPWTLDQAGTYPHICTVQGASMSGTIIVNGEPPTPTPPTPSPTPTPALPPALRMPAVAWTPLEADGSSGGNTGLLAGIVAAIAVTLGGAAWYGRRRWAT